jgi:ribosomal protein S18 acetylase RimI-like enzyme
MTRRAHDSDADAIASIHVRSWQTIYRGVMPDEFLDRLSVADRTTAWRKVLMDAGSDVLVLDDELGAIAGFCSLTRSRDTDGDAATGEITAIHVDPDRRRTGFGTLLVGEACKLARARGFTQMTLWVLEANTDARGFYETAGFRRDGAEKMEDRVGCVLRAFRYRRTLSPQ